MEVTKNISQKHQTLYSPTPRGRGWEEAFGCGAGCPTSVRPSCARRRTCRRQSHRHRPQNGRPGIDTVNLFFGSMFAVQCDQIGWFVKVLGNKKVAQFFVAFSATLKNFDCPVKPNIFWQNLGYFLFQYLVTLVGDVICLLRIHDPELNWGKIQGISCDCQPRFMLSL